MSFRLALGSWESLRDEASPVRQAVFVAEQKVPLEMEWDEMDPLSLHALAYDTQGCAVGTGRLLPDGHIGRMAVLKPYRGKGIGTAILLALMDHARARGDRVIVLNAQTHAEAFYARHGFVPEGEEFMEAGIPHRMMRREFYAK